MKHISLFTKMRERLKVIYTSVTILILVNSTTVLAAENKYAKNASDWVLSGAQALVMAAAAVIIGTFILKKKFTQMAVAIAISAIIISIVYNPTLLKTIGEYLTHVIFG
ncbi:TcpD family membrane protein [Clostridium hydrogeniformans]|uniref:TcpD family membrane protein n=1 Tax=Clostridium hydrogeniformans TaxID=349933 RepID=UPI00047FCE96|nr:TcpD family membrane protein [Clostridium hydrogeniformans]